MIPNHYASSRDWDTYDPETDEYVPSSLTVDDCTAYDLPDFLDSLGSGATRTAYEIDSDAVLKVVRVSGHHAGDNASELRNYERARELGLDRHLAPILAAASDASWLVVARADTRGGSDWWEASDWEEYADFLRGPAVDLHSHLGIGDLHSDNVGWLDDGRLVAIDYAFSGGPLIRTDHIRDMIGCDGCTDLDCHACHWDRYAGAGYAGCCGSWRGHNRRTCHDCLGTADRWTWAHADDLESFEHALDPFLFDWHRVAACDDCHGSDARRGTAWERERIARANVGNPQLFRWDGALERPRFHACAVRWCHDLAPEARNVCLHHIGLNNVGALLATDRVKHRLERSTYCHTCLGGVLLNPCHDLKGRTIRNRNNNR